MLTVTESFVKMEMLRRTERSADGVCLVTGDGSVAFLRADHPHFEKLLISATSVFRADQPLGLALDATGTVIDLGDTHTLTVYKVEPFWNDPERYEVSLWGISPTLGLSPDQPEFERIIATLAAAAGTPRRFRVAVHAVGRVECTWEDGGVSALPRLMDLRPL